MHVSRLSGRVCASLIQQRVNRWSEAIRERERMRTGKESAASEVGMEPSTETKKEKAL